MDTLYRVAEDQPKWYPVSIAALERLLAKVVAHGYGHPHAAALRKNLAYNLQYVEYLDATLKQINMSEVIKKQTYKTFIVTGCGLVESLLKFQLIRHGHHATTEWAEIYKSPGAEKTVDGRRQKINSHVLAKLDAPVRTQMNFDAVIAVSKNRKVLGRVDGVYRSLDRLRRLRNRVHLQKVENDKDTDYSAFQQAEFDEMRKVLHVVFTSTIFRPNIRERAFFDYLIR